MIAYPPKPLDNNMVRMIVSLVDRVLLPILHVNVLDAAHKQLQFILVENL